MSRTCTWKTTFNDGTTVTVAASGKRMAMAEASVRAQRLANEIEKYAKLEGNPRNGNKAWKADRARSASSRFDRIPTRRPTYDSQLPWERRPSGSRMDWTV